MSKPHRAALSALEQIRQYVQAAKRHQSAPHDYPKPSRDFVTRLIADHWLTAIKKVELRKDGEVIVTYAKAQKTTERIFDLEGLLIQIVLLSFGGSTNIDDHGTGEKHYPRMTLREGCRPFVMRLLANTPPDKLTREPKDYHDLRLRSLCGEFEIDRDVRPDRGQTGAKIGRAEAKAALLTNYDESKLSPDSTARTSAEAITREELSTLVDDLFALLDRHHPGIPRADQWKSAAE